MATPRHGGYHCVERPVPAPRGRGATGIFESQHTGTVEPSSPEGQVAIENHKYCFGTVLTPDAIRHLAVWSTPLVPPATSGCARYCWHRSGSHPHRIGRLRSTPSPRVDSSDAC